MSWSLDIEESVLLSGRNLRAACLWSTAVGIACGLFAGGCGDGSDSEGRGPDSRLSAQRASPPEIADTGPRKSPDLPAQGAAQPVLSTPPNARAMPALEQTSQGRVELSSSDPVALREQALAALESGEDDLAFAAARRAMRLAPKDPQVVFLMGLVLADRHRFRQAIKTLEGLVAAEPSARLPVMGQTAEWMVLAGMWEQAEQRYRSILTEVPDSVLVHRNLSSLLLRRGHRQEALQHLRFMCRQGDIQESELREMLRVALPFAAEFDRDREPVGVVGKAAAEASLGKLPEAALVLSGAPDDDVQAVALRGRVLAMQADWDSLRDWLAGDLELVSKTSHYAFARGALAAEEGDHRGAALAFCDAVRRDPTCADAYRGFARSLEKLAYEEQAAEAFRRADLLAETHRLGAEMAQTNRRDHASITRLIELLGQLRRPLEALGWKGVRLAYRSSHRAVTQAEAEQELRRIMSDRKRWLDGEQAASDEFLLCGFAVESLEKQSEIDSAQQPRD